MSASLLIDNVAMPEPKFKGISFKREKIWSRKTGRGDSGTMLGDLVATKTTMSINWPPLTDAEAALIDGALAPGFISVTYRELSGTMATKTFYAGSPTYSVYSYYDGVKTFEGIAVDLIEQ